VPSVFVLLGLGVVLVAWGKKWVRGYSVHSIEYRETVLDFSRGHFSHASEPTYFSKSAFLPLSMKAMPSGTPKGPQGPMSSKLADFKAFLKSAHALGAVSVVTPLFLLAEYHPVCERHFVFS
jgi:hypothetical protein